MEGTILLVDDEEKDLKLLEKLLLPEGYKILKADGGVEALEILKTESVQLVLLDIVMPGLSGYDVLRTIRETRGLTALPVIIVSALINTDERIKGLQAGADDFISKPFDLTELRVKINNQVKLNYLRMQLNEKAKLLIVIDKLNEGIIVANNKFVPISINSKARELLGLKEDPVNIMTYLEENFNEGISGVEGKTTVILKKKLDKYGKVLFLSLTVEPIRDASGGVDSYIVIIKTVE